MLKRLSGLQTCSGHVRREAGHEECGLRPPNFTYGFRTLAKCLIAERTDRLSIGLNKVRVKYRRSDAPGDRAQALQGWHVGNQLCALRHGGRVQEGTSQTTAWGSAGCNKPLAPREWERRAKGPLFPKARHKVWKRKEGNLKN